LGLPLDLRIWNVSGGNLQNEALKFLYQSGLRRYRLPALDGLDRLPQRDLKSAHAIDH
jgi:hypothetical protein